MKRLALLALLVAWGCATASKPQPVPEAMHGVASWYGQEFAGRTTANGEIFDPMLFTAAHRSLPFGTQVKVTNLSNQRSVVVRINDRGPYYQGRIIDLSLAAAERLEMVKSGITKVKLEVLDATRTSSN